MIKEWQPFYAHFLCSRSCHYDRIISYYSRGPQLGKFIVTKQEKKKTGLGNQHSCRSLFWDTKDVIKCLCWHKINPPSSYILNTVNKTSLNIEYLTITERGTCYETQFIPRRSSDSSVFTW